MSLLGAVVDGAVTFEIPPFTGADPPPLAAPVTTFLLVVAVAFFTVDDVTAAPTAELVVVVDPLDPLETSAVGDVVVVCPTSADVTVVADDVGFLLLPPQAATISPAAVSTAAARTPTFRLIRSITFLADYPTARVTTSSTTSNASNPD
jgi:hypothetical protein